MNPLDTFMIMQKKQKNQIYETDSVSGGMQNLDDKIAMNQVAIAQSLADQQKQQMEPSYGATMGETSEYSPSAQLQSQSLLNGVPVTQRFGNKNAGLERYSGGVNLGTDFGVKKGTPLALPPGNWEVVKSVGGAVEGNRGANSGSGNLVKVLNQSTGEYLTFEHLDKINVQPGQVLGGGTVIGLSGNTGNSTGPHASIPYQTPDGKYHDVLNSPYAKYLFGGQSLTTNGKGGGVADTMKGISNRALDFVKLLAGAYKAKGEAQGNLNNEVDISLRQRGLNPNTGLPNQEGMSRLMAGNVPYKQDPINYNNLNPEEKNRLFEATTMMIGGVSGGLSSVGGKLTNPLNKNLVALHNMSASGLEKSLVAGGIPSPSLAITAKNIPFDDFGEISLLGAKELIDPQNMDNYVFSGDTYTPRVPRPEYIAKNISKTPYEAEFAKRNIYAGDLEDLTKEQVFSRLTRKTNAKGEQIPFTGDEANKIVDDIFGDGFLEVKKEKIGLFTERLSKKISTIKDIIKNSRSSRDLRITLENDPYIYPFLNKLSKDGDIGSIVSKIEKDSYENVPYNLENQVKKARELVEKNAQNIRGTEQGWGQTANPRIHGYKQFKSIDEIRNSQSKLMTKEAAEDFGQKAENDLYSYLEKKGLNTDSWSNQNLFTEIVSKNKFDDASFITKYLREFDGFEKITEKEAEKIGKLMKKAYKEVPTDYFEAKIMRPVKVDEFKGALIPNSGIYGKDKLIENLKQMGLKVVEYNPGVEGDRQIKLMDNFGNIFFSSLAGLSTIAIFNKMNQENKSTNNQKL